MSNWDKRLREANREASQLHDEAMQLGYKLAPVLRAT